MEQQLEKVLGGLATRDRLDMVRNYLRVAACKMATMVCIKSCHMIPFEEIRLALFNTIENVSDDELLHIWDNPSDFSLPVIRTQQFEADLSDLAQLEQLALHCICSATARSLKRELTKGARDEN